MGNIIFVKGNIFNTKAQTVVNTVNCRSYGKRDSASLQTALS